MTRWRQLLGREDGTSAVEFTLILPVLLLVLFGIIELGSAWYARQMMVNASREGARFGVLLSESEVGDTEVETRVQELLTEAGFPLEATVVSTGASSATGGLVTVQVTAQCEMPVLSTVIPGVGDEQGQVTLSAETVMRHE
ncbi:MAG: pilus assembly protein [Deltaproteobacteria bacterium]|nr:pilus assembly protein [Deltaproteobacteria bacterium]